MAKELAKPEADKAGKKAPSKRKSTTAASPVATAKPSKAPTARRASKNTVEALTSAIASLYETATEIVADRLQPNIDQIKALAHAVIGHEEKKARKARAKGDKPGKARKSEGGKAAAKPKKKKN